MKIAIAADHGGYEYKDILTAYLTEKGHTVEDMGCFSGDSVDYPDYAIPLGERVSNNEFDRGILLCGTGIGMSVAANKVSGVRCALCAETVSARLARAHNNANVLAMGARVIGIEMAKAIIEVFLETQEESGRHARRVEKIKKYDAQRLKKEIE